MSITIGELKEKIKSIKKADLGAEIKIHAESGDYEVSALEFSKHDGIFRICTADEEKKQVFRISYLITKDNRPFAFDTVRRTLIDENDIILNIEEWQSRFLHDCHIDGEISEKTGSVVISEREQHVKVDPETEKAKLVDTDVNHYYNCKILEVFKEIDSDNDIYVRVWKDGNIG